MIKYLILSVFALSTTWSAASTLRTISSFSVVRKGGGAREVMVQLDPDGQIRGFTTVCLGRTLNPSEQKNTAFVLTGAEEMDAKALLSDAVVFAQIITLQPPPLTGTWLELNVNYQYSDFNNGLTLATETLERPIVIVGGKISDIVDSIDAEARVAAGLTCR